MKKFNKIKYSDFQTVQEVMSEIEFNYNPSERSKKEHLFEYWVEFVGEKLSKFTKPVELKDNNVLVVLCKNSLVASELFMVKNNIIELMQDKLDELNLTVKDIYFDYKNWKNNETR